MCSGSETGPYLRLIDYVYLSTLGLRVIKKKKRPSGGSADPTFCRTKWFVSICVVALEPFYNVGQLTLVQRTFCDRDHIPILIKGRVDDKMFMNTPRSNRADWPRSVPEAYDRTKEAAPVVESIIHDHFRNILSSSTRPFMNGDMITITKCSL